MNLNALIVFVCTAAEMEQKTLEEAEAPSPTWPLSSLWPDLSSPSTFQWSFLTNVYTSLLDPNERQLFKGQLLLLHQYHRATLRAF